MTSTGFVQATCPVIENVPLARDTYRLRIECPPLAERIRPGQFLMLRLPERTDPLLGRAFALYDTVLKDGEPLGVDVVYLVVGKMTGLMAGLSPADRVEVWGPLGSGFQDYVGVEHLLMVAGGIGQTPFPALLRQVLGQKGYGGRPARRQVEGVSFYWGVRSAALFGGIEDFEGAEVKLATDDGSRGFHGLVTGLLERELAGLVRSGAARRLKGDHYQRMAGCGPEPMLHALAKMAERHGLPCDVSLETPMACGVGVCFSCVTRVRHQDTWDYRRVCVEGPIFEAERLVW